jgi:hypothetical protein
MFFTFSSINAGGLFAFKMAAILKNRFPCLLCSKPCFLPRLIFFETPAIEKGWHGKPARRISKSRIVFGSIF